MIRRVKAVQLIFITVTLLMMGLLFSSLADLNPISPFVKAQHLSDISPASNLSNRRISAAHGQAQIQGAGALFDLEASVNPGNLNLDAGDPFSFDVSIKNLGPNSASAIQFSDVFPSVMKNVVYQFTPSNVVNNGLADPTWLFLDPVAKNGKVKITVSGNIDPNSCSGTASYTGQASAYDMTADTQPNNDTATFNVNITNSGSSCTNGDIYLPRIVKNPTPTPIPVLFFDDFNNSNSGWPVTENNDCNYEYRNGEYQIEADRNAECFAPGPKEAEFIYGEFETSVRRSGGSDEFWYGIYINGQGGDNYYLFEVKHRKNDCDWNLIRKSSRVLSGSCDSITAGFDQPNVIAIRHTTNGTITVIMNGLALGVFGDGSQLTNRGTGLYINEASGDDNVDIRFNYFIVNP